MQSPRVEWVLGLGYLAAVDLIRARGEADGDTASECLRDLVSSTPGGRRLFTLGLIAAAMVFHEHIVAPLRVESGPQERPGRVRSTLHRA